MARPISFKETDLTPILSRYTRCLKGTQWINSTIISVLTPCLTHDRITNTTSAGIGTYSKGANENAGSLQFLPKTRAYISATLDQMFGISFVDHVLGGYKFVMRYWEPGDDIYIFGFSRGAYTARFLAEMIHGIGLLSRGNEEMVHFAWETFSNFQRSRGNVPQTKKDTDILEYMENFKTTFCKPEIHVHFLGLFDCVNSVGQFEVPLFRKSYRYASTPPAKHIRHAASIHERRLKFKPALCIFENLRDEHTGEHASLKEHWFAGNHGDVGGGWGPEKKQGECLLSDITLKWMVDEMMSVDVKGRGGELKLIEGAEEKCRDDAKQIQIAHDNGTINGPLVGHDMLAYGHGAPFYMTFIWWIIGKPPLRWTFLYLTS